MNRLAALMEVLRELGPAAVAVSGGVDSMTLAFVAHTVNRASQMFHAVSPAVPEQATARVRDHAAAHGWNLNVIDAREIEDPQYIANPANRCYFCKTNLYDTVVRHTHLPVISGTNLDDLGDYRPGLIAAEEHAVRYPYVEAGIDKAGLRDIAKSLGLTDLKDLPAAPCLSSRVTTGIAIQPSLLPVINRVEQAVTELLEGKLRFEGVRCRVRPGLVAIEIDSPETVSNHSPFAAEIRAAAGRTLQAGGYPHLADAISVEPYQRGSAFLIDTLQV